MGPFDIFDAVERLRQSGRPFCIATVVRTADVTSAKAGAKAAVTENGEIIGHLGGGCVQGAVRKAAQEALGSGQTRLIRVKPSEKVVSLADEDGVRVFKSGCPSGGTVDVLIEPYELSPMVVVFGATPIAQAIAAHGLLAGYRVAVPDGVEAPAGAARFAEADLGPLGLGERDFVVVASQGRGDLACLRAALESPARRVSMVASRKKAETLVARLWAEGMAPERTERLKSPAGLDIKAIDPHEIALSVLAEIVVWRNMDRKERAGEGQGGASRDGTV